MDNDKLLIGGIAVIVLVLAMPFVYPMLVDTSGYDAAKDTQNMERIYKAIGNYGAINQQYPPSLHHLVPDYLAEVPLTSTNQQFLYDPRTGQLTNPASTPTQEPQRAGRRGSGSGGIPPATDAMTGLGVAEELNF